MSTVSSRKVFKNVFVTVGTTRFDDLLSALFSTQVLESLDRLGCQELVVQAGKSNIPEQVGRCSIQIKTYGYKESIAKDISEADLVIGHSGAGTTLEVLRSGTPFLTVINSKLMDNHQLELAQQLQKDGHLTFCYPGTLLVTLDSLRELSFKPLPASDPSTFAKFVDQVMGFS